MKNIILIVYKKKDKKYNFYKIKHLMDIFTILCISLILNNSKESK